MPLVPGNMANLRQVSPEPDAPTDGIAVELAEDAPDSALTDERGNIIKIEHGDGSVTVSLGGSLGQVGSNSKNVGWFENLAELIDPQERMRIAEDLLRGIRDDLESRKDWIEARATGIRLLGLTIEIPGLGGGGDGAPVEGMSKVRHPLLLEAVLRFQANAYGEMLPADGPVKIRNDSNNDTLQLDQLANALEQDMNHFLTYTASEYYPDTDRMLLMLGFGGLSFKKVYFCPLRNRPVSETVDADDLIVNNAATDLANAKRVTHRIYMRPSVVKRMQIMGIYRDIDLSAPMPENVDAAREERANQQGIARTTPNPDDRDREIYECYCELDIKGFEHEHKGAPSGLEIPYRVTIDVSSKEILSIVRNYKEDTKELPVAKKTFVPYVFVPGFGFYPIGLLHILGNTTNAITAAWRELLDAGMYANFPGFLQADTGARQNTNIFRIPPGGGQIVKTGGMALRDAIMPLPYKEPSQALNALVQDMAATGQRIGGTSELQIGEGRADIPVGTTLALIEQATKVLNSVHKRMHSAQCDEFELLIEQFRDHPESFWQCKRRPSGQAWDEATFMRALDNCNLVPRADPNTASQSQRLMKVMALKQLSMQSPSLYDPIKVDTAAIQAIGYSDPTQFFAPPDAQAKPPPELLEIQSKIKTEGQLADAKTMEANAKMAEANAKIAAAKAGEGQNGPDPVALMTAKTRMMDAQTNRAKLGLQHRDTEIEDQNRDLDRQSRERIEVMNLAKEIMMNPGAGPPAAHEAEKIDEEIKPDGGS